MSAIQYKTSVQDNPRSLKVFENFNKIWSHPPESNRRPADYESPAAPPIPIIPRESRESGNPSGPIGSSGAGRQYEPRYKTGGAG